MRSHDVLRLSLGNQTIRTFVLPDHTVEIGSDPSCDITIPSEAVAARALLVQRRAGSVFLYDLARAPGVGCAEIMALEHGFPLGDGYELTRSKGLPKSRPEPRTEILRAASVASGDLALTGAPGTGLRPVRIGTQPLSVGSADDNRILVRDRAVSRYHCRVEPSGGALRIRDLGSTNGTWVDGARVERHELRLGSRVRVGRTVLRVVEHGLTERRGAVFASDRMASVMASVDRFATLPWPVLVRGETGVGKELIARALHDRSPRSEGPFVALNAGGLARELVESELFGHERGAFTGAVQSHRGAFEQANEGTLFLDEIGELPLCLQTRLLRVLETWRVRRVGAEADRSVDLRLVCATHANLRQAVRRGEFRADLFYRLHRLVIEVPPLRARREDIGALAEHFLREVSAHVGPRELSQCGLDRLRFHLWPGNVRELRNALELAAVQSDSPIIDLGAVERAIRTVGEVAGSSISDETIREALHHHGGNVSAAARTLGLPRSTLRDRMKASAQVRLNSAD